MEATKIYTVDSSGERDRERETERDRQTDTRHVVHQLANRVSKN